MSIPKKLLVIGISHHRTPLELREKFTLSESLLAVMAHDFLSLDAISEVIFLHTCNRVEVYLATTHSVDTTTLLSILARHDPEQERLWQDFHYSHSNSEMILHLFSVTAGLDSQMVGETEILGQAKKSLHGARKAQWAGNRLGPIFERAFQAAKWARTHTGIGQGQVTIGNVVVDLASRIFGDLEDQRILLIGSGDVAERTAQSLVSRGARDVTITGRTHDRAFALSQQIGAATLPFDSFHSRLPFFDILICSTASDTPILTRTNLDADRKERRYKPVLVIDVAVPRDVEAAAGVLDAVFLYNMDDLAHIANENLSQRKKEIQICLQELKRRSWWTWLNSFRRDLVPL